MDNSLLTQMENIDFVTAVQNLIKKECIIDFGIVHKVRAKGIVDVVMSVSSTKQNIVLTTCVLANTSSKSFTLDIAPNEGDRVIVFYPRNYDENMFVADNENKEIIVNSKAKHYSLLGGIAFLFNQCKTRDHKNVLNISEEGNISYIAKDSDDNVINELALNTDGTAFLKTKADNKALHTWELKSNEVSLVSKSGDDTILSLNAKADGITLEDKNGCKIVSSSSSIKINNKLEIKK